MANFTYGQTILSEEWVNTPVFVEPITDDPVKYPIHGNDWPEWIEFKLFYHAFTSVVPNPYAP